MEILWGIFLGALGAIAGSFAGATVWRLHKKKNFLNDRSECEECHKKLRWLELIPIFSFIFLRGKCARCGKNIGWDKFWIEVIGATVFVLSYIYFPFRSGDGVASALLLTLWLLIMTGFLILGLYDYKYKLLPDKILWPTAALALVFCATRFAFYGGNIWGGMEEFFLALMPVSGFYLLLWFIGEKSGKPLVGLGDVKLGIIFALLMTWQGTLTVLMLANIVGSVVVMILMIASKIKINTKVPFGPFLITAFIVIFLSGVTFENVITFMLKW